MTQDETKEKAQFLAGTEEYNAEQQKLFDEAIKTTQYWKFQDLAKHLITFTKWELNKKMVDDFNDKTKQVEKIEFKATIFIDKKEYVFSSLSTRFMIAVEPYLRGKNPLKDKVELQINKIGEGNGTQYNVEEIKEE